MTVTTPQDEQLGAAIGAIPSGLFIVTSQQNGKTATMLASWVQQSGFAPPSVTIIVAKGRPIESFLTIGSPVMVNIAEKGQGGILLRVLLLILIRLMVSKLLLRQAVSHI
jgi:3-hydroxy-9,10-secoandrosta-1,3,5(10)-triene-9,17-dione monooxygenase reductase component